MQNDKKYWMWLGAMTGVTSKRANLLLEHYKDPINIFEASETELSQFEFMSRQSVLQLLDRTVKMSLNEVVAETFRKGIDIVTLVDEEYPEQLKRVFDPPVCLFRRGKPRRKKDYIAIVGTRRPSAYGYNTAWTLAAELAASGYSIISGLAMGIDSAAHKSAIAVGKETIAILGCGVDRVYPACNKELMEAIIKSGAAYSEFLPGTFPAQANFPRRNRIISGMSIATVVIEAGEKSGALITAGFAAEQGRDVFSVPGNITSPMSVGTNKLIRDGAVPVTCVEDIIYELNPFLHLTEDNTKRESKAAEKRRKLIELKTSELSDSEIKVINCVIDNGPSKIDDIIRHCDSKSGEINSTVVILEMKGILRLLPGMLYDF